MLERIEPRTLLWWLIVAGIVYVIFPFDLIPDLFGIPGRFDDLAAIVALAWYYRKHLRRYVASKREAEARRGRTNDAGPKPADPPRPEAFDAYAVLGIARPASRQEIRAAYLARMKEYHPDKVAHLGEDLRELAEAKTREIQRAYKALGG